jgi:hypothetical protein
MWITRNELPTFLLMTIIIVIINGLNSPQKTVNVSQASSVTQSTIYNRKSIIDYHHLEPL